MLGLRGKRPAPPDFWGPVFCISMNRKKQIENTWMFSAEVMTSKILIDEFQYEEDICLNFGPVMQKQKSSLEDFTSIPTFQDGKNRHKKLLTE